MDTGGKRDGVAKLVIYQAEAKKVVEHFQKSGVEVKADDLQHALMEKLDARFGPEIMEPELTASEMIELLKDFDFRALRSQIVATVETDEGIPTNIPRLLLEKRIKNRGEVWEIHKNDADPFPSNPHAHNVDTQLKLDLVTGKLYRKREHVAALSAGVFAQLKEKIAQANIKLPVESVAERKSKPK